VSAALLVACFAFMVASTVRSRPATLDPLAQFVHGQEREIRADLVHQDGFLSSSSMARA
jgi:hypothetical protein